MISDIHPIRSFQTKLIIFFLVVFYALAMLPRLSRAQSAPEPSNQVVVVIDGSGSYRTRQREAIDRTLSLLDGMAQTKLQRWESETDVITIISLDAMPDILWKGNLRELKAMDTKEWANRFRARSDYASCTDVGAAFDLAASHLDGDPRFVSKYLFVFSDLIDEPPTKSIRKCRPASHEPPTTFPWESLEDVSVSVFWVPPDQKLLWKRAAEQHGLSPIFALYTTSESSSVSIAPPPRPTVKVTEADRETNREKYKQWAGEISRWGLWFVLLLFLLPVVGAFLSRCFRRSLPRDRGGARRPPQPVPVAPGRTVPPIRPRSPQPIRPLVQNPNHPPRH